MKRSRSPIMIRLAALSLGMIFAAMNLITHSTAVTSVIEPAPATPEKKFSDWSTPTNLGPTINTQFNEIMPHMSKNGLSLYFISNRPGGFGDFDIWVSQRAAQDDEWGPPMNLGPTINTGANDRAPALSRDGHSLFFATNRPGGFGELDIWVSRREHTHDDFGWQPPVNLGAGVNGSAADFGPHFLENNDTAIPSLTFVSNRPGGVGDNDIYISYLLADGAFGPASLITELSSQASDLRPTIRPDGLELFFNSNRPSPPGMEGVGRADLWSSVRESVAAPWSPPVHLGPIINSQAADVFPALSSDGRSLIFASDRPGGFGENDLYLSVRDKH